MMGFIAELQRRNVFRAATLYAAAAWLAVQVATQVLPVFAAPDWTLRLIVVAAVLGFPFVLVFSWYYELTPEGLKRESEVPREASITHLTAKKLDRAIIAVLCVIVVLLLANTFVAHRETTDVPDKSVAVLPLLNENSDANDQYFSDGLSEDLISMLSQVRGLTVIGRRSSFQFRGDISDSRGIAAKLGVATLLEGTVRRQGKRVRIVASLISAQDNRVLWSQVYERELKDIFDVQSDIARSVAGALQIKLLGPEAASPLQPSNRNPAAHNALLEGNFYSERRTEGDYQKSIDYYSEAIRLDPRYALAYARRSVARVYLAASFLGSDRAASVFSAARADARQALAIDPDLAEGHLALGWVMEYADIDMRGAEAQYRRALDLAPGDPVASRRIGGILANLGRLDEAVRYTQSAIKHDPLVSANFFNLALYQTALGHYADARAALAKALELQPDSSGFHMQLAMIAALEGNHEDAMREAQLEPAGPWRDLAVAMAQQVGGDPAQADAALQTLIAAHKGDMPFQIAEVYAFRKQPDPMFAWLDRAWSSHDPGVTALLYDPFLLAYRHDPRFAAFCRKARLPVPE